ncbi:hypothetical protein FA13DRAFT_708177 [Coprinellus micaceus]|uniref:Uncharacterized protein n=1 Tax=Coprinellus micaceus TaxID=71717 RepID=A0A4Y7TUD8_COPMI|nr:hypothetical protein FA13DRAFT_708177 [Coprinellus micaceus]
MTLEIDSLRAQLRARENEVDELWAELTTIAESFEQSQREEDDARVDVEELRRLNAIIESQCNNVADELETARKEAEGAKDEVCMLEASLWFAKEEIRVAKADAERARSEAVRAWEEIEYLRRALSADTDIDKLLAIIQVSMELDDRRQGCIRDEGRIRGISHASVVDL